MTFKFIIADWIRYHRCASDCTKFSGIFYKEEFIDQCSFQQIKFLLNALEILYTWAFINRALYDENYSRVKLNLRLSK